MKIMLLLVALTALLSACRIDEPSATPEAARTGENAGGIAEEAEVPSTAPGPVTPSAPPTPSGPLPPGVEADLDRLFDSLSTGLDLEAVSRVGDSGDVRLAWLMSDLLRFLGPGDARAMVRSAFVSLTGVGVAAGNPWVESANLLIEWDLPEPPRYRELKGELFTTVDPRWAPFFDDEESELDYRWLNWGGVRPDDRPFGDFEATCRGGCIPALDNPGFVDAASGDWYPDDAIVFGVAIGDGARAYPKNMMEVHEMVIDTVGGVRFGMPYCTLCGSAQAYDLESVPDGVEPPVLRTSGLLSRSNKVMFDLNTWSAFDTFTGRAVSGPLRAAGTQLEQLTVVTATWGAWKKAHPDTTILAEDGGIGRRYEADPLHGRDDDGPIFPVGHVDPRLPVQEQILGVQAPDGVYLAFPAEAAGKALDAGEVVELSGVRLVRDADGLRAELVDGTPIVSHQAFWFAWSQFHVQSEVWTGTGL